MATIFYRFYLFISLLFVIHFTEGKTHIRRNFLNASYQIILFPPASEKNDMPKRIKKKYSHDTIALSTTNVPSTNLMQEYILTNFQKNESVATENDKKLDTNCTNFLDCLQVRNYGSAQYILIGKLSAFVAFGILIVVACLWCTKGWCCCCCPCECCQVSSRLDEATKYLAYNPPGVLYHNGEQRCYTPSATEILLYETMTNTLMNI